jgi:hypothetical protein
LKQAIEGVFLYKVFAGKVRNHPERKQSFGFPACEMHYNWFKAVYEPLN